MEPAPVPTLIEVTEGRTTLAVPASDHERGPKRREGVPFYNPTMRVSRDLSVLVLQELTSLEKKTWHVCDAMAATGARGLRLANEVSGTKVQLNDANPDSIQLAQQNARRLGLANVDFRVGRLESHLAAERYDWVDIDPFGTPAPFIDVSILSVEDDGILAITATDTASLSGVYPSACMRRYNAKPRRADCMPELATRILVGAIVRAAGRRDRGARPMLAYATEHFVRAYVRLSGGAKDADAAAQQIGFAVFGPDLTRRLGSTPGTPSATAGPLWTGALWDAAFVRRLAERATQADWMLPAATRLLHRIRDEADAPPLYYDIDDFTRRAKANAPPIEDWLQRLRDAGHVATRTHFSPRGIKTTASPEDVMRALVPP